MKSMPASSAMRASARQSAQLADQRSGTRVAVRDDEQLAPNMPIFSTFELCMSMRSLIDGVCVGTAELCFGKGDVSCSATSMLASSYIGKRGSAMHESRRQTSAEGF